MQVENIEGLTRDDITLALQYLELVMETLEEIPAAMDSVAGKLLKNPELFLKIAAFMSRG